MLYRKYVDIAYRSRPGTVLLQKVEDSWRDWIHIVQKARWLRSWGKVGDEPGCTPGGVECPDAYGLVAEKVFATAVWGYGVQCWPDSRGSLQLQALRELRGTGEYIAQDCLWDEEYRTKYGLLIPCEFADLDRWLESLA